MNMALILTIFFNMFSANIKLLDYSMVLKLTSLAKETKSSVLYICVVFIGCRQNAVFKGPNSILFPLKEGRTLLFCLRAVIERNKIQVLRELFC